MPKSRAAEARERKKAKRAEEKQEREEKKRAAENMIGSFSFPASAATDVGGSQSGDGIVNSSAKRRKGATRTAIQPEKKANTNNRASEKQDTAESGSQVECVVRDYYQDFFDKFMRLVDCCPRLDEKDCRDRKHFEAETAALDRFKRNLSRAATRYLLPVLEEQIQDMKDMLPENEVANLKQKYRHKVPASAMLTHDNEATQVCADPTTANEIREENPRTSSCSNKEEGAGKDDHLGVLESGSTEHDGSAERRRGDQSNDEEEHSDSDREGTPDAERLLAGEILEASIRGARPSGVHQQDHCVDFNEARTEHLEESAKEVQGQDGDHDGRPAAQEGVVLADCSDPQQVAAVLRRLGLSRLAEASIRCSISGDVLVDVLDSVPPSAFLAHPPAVHSLRPSNGSEKSAAETVEVSTAREELNESAPAVAPVAAVDSPMAAERKEGQVWNLGVVETNSSGAPAESDEEEDAWAEPSGVCRHCNEPFRLDDVLRLPKLLVCCHTLCAGCASSVTACPWCQHPVRQQEALTEDRLEVEKVLVRCDQCERGQYAVTECLDCNTRLCNDCNDGHSRVALSSEHQVRELEQAGFVPKQYCVADGHDHGPYEVYCKTCDMILCSKGFMQDHMVHNHEYSWIGTVSDTDRSALMELQQDIAMVLKYRDPRNVQRKVSCAEKDGRRLERHLDALVRLVGELRAETLASFRSKAQRDIAALAQLRWVPGRPARQAVRYSEAVMKAAAVHSSHPGGVVHHYVLHKTGKDALQRYKECVLDSSQVTASALHDRETMQDGSPLHLFRERLVQMSASCTEIGNTLCEGSMAKEHSKAQARTPDPPAVSSEAAATSA